MTYTWSEFQAAVLGFITDRKPTDDTFAVAVQEYVRARIAINILGDKDAYSLLERKYTQLRKALIGYQTTAIDSALRVAVKLLLRDTAADDTMFVEATANFVRAQIDKESGRGAAYASLRLKLAGYQTTLNDTALRAAVRTSLSDGPRTNSAFAQAVALYVRAAIARDIDARDAASADAAKATADSCMEEYRRMRFRLAGFNHTLGGGLTTEVQKYLTVDKGRANYSTYIATLINNAVEDLQALGTWLDGQIATAKDDLQSLNTWLDAQIDAGKKDIQSLNDRVQREIRAGAIDLQRLIRAYQIGQVDIVTSEDVDTEGFASVGSVDDGQIRLASILINGNTSPDIQMTQGTLTPANGVVTSLKTDELRVLSLLVEPDGNNQQPVLIGYDTDSPVAEAPMALPVVRGEYYDLSKVVIKTQAAGDKVNFIAVLALSTEDTAEKECAQIAWPDRRGMVGVQSCAPQIAIDPKGDAFFVTPQLVGEEISLRLEWDGVKLDFDDDDDTTFDEGAAEAVGHYVNSKLAIEWGESGSQVQLHAASYRDRRTALYLKHRARSEVRR
jgi:hypothetical protein